jgi:hypothetical protein
LSADLAIGLLLAIAGTWLWIGHGRARDLGRGSDVLGYDAAQYAVAARELADHGRLATPFALPIELVRHARPPWPLSLVQPGLLAGEAALFRLSGTSSPARLGLARARDPVPRLSRRGHRRRARRVHVPRAVRDPRDAA